MQGDKALNELQDELHCVLDEIRRCSYDGASSWDAAAAMLRHLRSAIDRIEALPVRQQPAFPSGALEALAAIAACHDPGSAAAAACVSVVLQLVRGKAARDARRQLLQSQPALRCERAAWLAHRVGESRDRVNFQPGRMQSLLSPLPPASPNAGPHALMPSLPSRRPPCSHCPSLHTIPRRCRSMVLRVLMQAPARSDAFHVAACVVNGLVAFTNGDGAVAQIAAAAGGARAFAGRLLSATQMSCCLAARQQVQAWKLPPCRHSTSCNWYRPTSQTTWAPRSASWACNLHSRSGSTRRTAGA